LKDREEIIKKVQEEANQASIYFQESQILLEKKFKAQADHKSL